MSDLFASALEASIEMARRERILYEEAAVLRDDEKNERLAAARAVADKAARERRRAARAIVRGGRTTAGGVRRHRPRQVDSARAEFLGRALDAAAAATARALDSIDVPAVKPAHRAVSALSPDVDSGDSDPRLGEAAIRAVGDAVAELCDRVLAPELARRDADVLRLVGEARDSDDDAIALLRRTLDDVLTIVVARRDAVASDSLARLGRACAASLDAIKLQSKRRAEALTAANTANAALRSQLLAVRRERDDLRDQLESAWHALSSRGSGVSPSA